MARQCQNIPVRLVSKSKCRKGLVISCAAVLTSRLTSSVSLKPFAVVVIIGNELCLKSKTLTLQSEVFINLYNAEDRFATGIAACFNIQH